MKVTSFHVTLEMMQGSFSKQWKTELSESNEVVHEKVHRSLVLTNNVRFTNSKRLPIDNKRQLQKLYLNN